MRNHMYVQTTIYVVGTYGSINNSEDIIFYYFYIYKYMYV